MAARSRTVTCSAACASRAAYSAAAGVTRPSDASSARISDIRRSISGASRILETEHALGDSPGETA